MHLFVSTGETSGEQHAARLVRACAGLDPSLRWSGLGRDILRDAGVEIAVDASRLQVMGFLEVVGKLPEIRRVFHETLAAIEERKPDALVLVDYPGFHLRLARTVKRRFPDLPVVYYILPKAWAWNASRAKTIARHVDKALCILPFEPSWFGARGVEAEYVGNPVMDAVREAEGEALRDDLGLAPETPLVALFPGSRRSELRYMLRPLLQAAELLGERFPDHRFALAAAAGFDREHLQEICPIPASVPVMENRGLDLLAASRFALVKSGTTTLEAALLRVPMVTIYRAHVLSMILAALVVKVKHFSLPNLIADRPIVPELAQYDANARGIADCASGYLGDPQRYDSMRTELDGVFRAVGEKPAAERAARALSAFLMNSGD